MEAFFIHTAKKLEAVRLGVNKPIGVCEEELRSIEFWRAGLAELLAQFLFVFIVCISSTKISDKDEFSAQIKMALAIGLAMTAMLQALGHVTEGYMNPAVTFAMVVVQKMSILRGVLYLTAQCIGGVLGALYAKLLTPDDFLKDAIRTQLASKVTQAQGFGIESLLTFIFVLTTLGMTDPLRPQFGSPGLIIGLTFTMCQLAGIPYTGASLNPTRTLGTGFALQKWGDSWLYWDNHWLYWVAPLLGGLVAAVLYKYILNPYKGVLDVDAAIMKLQGESSIV